MDARNCIYKRDSSWKPQIDSQKMLKLFSTSKGWVNLLPPNQHAWDNPKSVYYCYSLGTFRYDLASLMPLEFFYLFFGVNATWLRLPRLIKVIAFWEFKNRLDAILAKVYTFTRYIIINTSHSILE